MKLPHLPHQPPIWREGLVGLEAAALFRDPIFHGEGVEDGAGQPVILIPGLLAGDGSLAVMTKWLRRTGYRTKRAGIRTNVDCSSALVDRLSVRLEELAERQGQRVAIVGQSRGGTLARVLAVRRPELVSGIVNLGSPTRDPFAVHPFVHAQILALGVLGSAGAPGLFRHTCLKGSCCRAFWEDLEAPFPSEVGFVSIYSRRDGVVNWRACLDSAAEHVEIGACHTGMGLNAAAYRTVAAALADFRRADAARSAAGDRPEPGGSALGPQGPSGGTASRAA